MLEANSGLAVRHIMPDAFSNHRISGRAGESWARDAAARDQRLVFPRGKLANLAGSAFQNRDEWLSPTADQRALAHVGIKADGGGPHQSKTMMLAELTTIFARSSPTTQRKRSFTITYSANRQSGPGKLRSR